MDFYQALSNESTGTFNELNVSNQLNIDGKMGIESYNLKINDLTGTDVLIGVHADSSPHSVLVDTTLNYSYDSGTNIGTLGVDTSNIRSLFSATGPVTYSNTTGIIDSTNITTDDVTEASNLYWTTARGRTAISATGAVTYNSTTGVIDSTNITTDDVTEATNLYYTDSRARSSLSVGSASLTYDSGTGILNTAQNITTAGQPLFKGLTVAQFAPTFSALSVDGLLKTNSSGAVGNVTIGSGLSYVSGNLTNEGVTELFGTANQVNVSSISGSVTLSTPQDINTTSSPTFAEVKTAQVSGTGTELAMVGDGLHNIVIKNDTGIDYYGYWHKFYGYPKFHKSMRILHEDAYPSNYQQHQIGIQTATSGENYEMRLGYGYIDSSQWRGFIDAVNNSLGTPLMLNPSGGHVAVGGNLGVGGVPDCRFDIKNSGTFYSKHENLSAGTDNKKWWKQITGTQMIDYVSNDANNSSAQWRNITRSGNSITSITYPSGNIGINETSPDTFLHVTGSGYNANHGYVKIESDTHASLRLQSTSSGTGRYSYIQLVNDANEYEIGCQSAVGLYFNSVKGSGSTNATMVMDSNRNVGIGTSPSAKLHLGSGGMLISSSITVPGTATPYGTYQNGEIRTTNGINASAGVLRLVGGGGDSNAASTSGIDISGYSGTPAYNNVIVFQTGGTERMRIDSSGRVGIGTSPSAKIHVHETLNTNTSYIHNDHASFSNIICQIQAQRASSGTGWTFLSTRSNVGGGGDYEHLLRGDGSSDADGSWNSAGADYAEYFESADGKAIEKGTSVVLDGEKVRPYDVELDQLDAIIGVSRPKEWGKSSASIGNSAGLRWANKYLTDEWGVYELEDYNMYEWKEITITVDEETKEEKTTEETKQWVDYTQLPDGETLESIQAKPNIIVTVQQKKKLNPNYNPEDEYIPREKRDEWILVGLLGQVPIRSDQIVNPRWRKMKEITPTVWMYLIR